MDDAIVERFRAIFYPRSIAVVGASRDVTKYSHGWLKALSSNRYRGHIYAVNPRETQIGDFPVYSSVRDIPGEVDFVIVCVPRGAALAVIEDCAAKGVKAAHFFTGGFRETGKAEDMALEEQLVAKAQQAGVRVIGPNCMGIYNPEAGIPLGPSSLMGKPGAVGFASQSGGHALKMAETGANIGIGYSKMVSYGNGADLEAADFIQYFAADPRTEIVSAYLEGCRDGRRLFEAIRVASSSKPVVVWKGGQSRQGAEAAASHTGSLVASVDMWRAALAQAGAVPVRDMEELADTLLLFQQVKTLKGLRVGIVCGLTDGGGGESVLSADHCAAHGIEVPRFSPQARQILSALFGEIGSVLRNPLDVSQAGGGVDKIRQGLEVVVSEQHLDAIIVYENADIIARFLPQGRLEEINRAVLDFAAKSKKPTVVVLPPGGNDRVWLETREALLKEGVAVFPSTDRAARAMANVRAYSARAGR